MTVLEIVFTVAIPLVIAACSLVFRIFMAKKMIGNDPAQKLREDNKRFLK